MCKITNKNRFNIKQNVKNNNNYCKMLKINIMELGHILSRPMGCNAKYV